MLEVFLNVSPDPLQGWLARLISRERAAALGVGLASGLGGLAVMLFTFGITYGSIWFISWTFFSSSSTVCLWLSLGMMVALFVGNLTTRREYLESYSFTTGTASDKVVSFHVPQVGMVSNINPLAPDSAHSFVKMVTGILFTGPRMIMGAIHGVRRWRRLGGIDIDGCAAILSLLLEKGQKVALTDIAAALPALSLESLFPQLAEINGVLFLKTGQPGLSLSSDLRREIGDSLRSR
jgi:hypothetical protein